MIHCWRWIALFCREEEGLTVVEYVVAASLIVVMISVVMVSLEVGLIGKFSSAISSAGSK